MLQDTKHLTIAAYRGKEAGSLISIESYMTVKLDVWVDKFGKETFTSKWYLISNHYFFIYHQIKLLL